MDSGSTAIANREVPLVSHHERDGTVLKCEPDHDSLV